MIAMMLPSWERHIDKRVERAISILIEKIARSVNKANVIYLNFVIDVNIIFDGLKTF